MLTLTEFKTRYQKELFGLEEKEIISYYNIYLEDPFEFHPSMMIKKLNMATELDCRTSEEREKDAFNKGMGAGFWVGMILAIVIFFVLTKMYPLPDKDEGPGYIIHNTK